METKTIGERLSCAIQTGCAEQGRICGRLSRMRSETGRKFNQQFGMRAKSDCYRTVAALEAYVEIFVPRGTCTRTVPLGMLPDGAYLGRMFHVEHWLLRPSINQPSVMPTTANRRSQLISGSPELKPFSVAAVANTTNQPPGRT